MPKGGMSLTGMTPDGKKRQVSLNYVVRNWPTPHKNCCTGSGSHGDGGDNLQTAILWPTATARDYKSGKGKTQKERGRSAGPSLSETCQGQLNADWVELLMGYDIGWTDVDCNNPTKWPGWPAGRGNYQHDYEPARTIIRKKNRAKRLKCLGNSVVPQQAYPIFKAIMEVS